MAWGLNIELYVAKKEICEADLMGVTLAAVGVNGENWSGEEVKNVADQLRKFSQKLDRAIKKHGAKNLCVRSNM